MSVIMVSDKRFTVGLGWLKKLALAPGGKLSAQEQALRGHESYLEAKRQSADYWAAATNR